MGILMILSVIGFVAGEVIRIQIMPTAGVTLLDAITSILAFVSVIIAFKQRHRLKEFTLTKPLSLFIILCLISLVFSPFNPDGHFLTSFLYLVRFILYLSIYFIVSLLPKDKKKVIPKYLLISGIALVVIGFVQFLFYPNLRNLYYLGWDDHLYRLFSTFLDPNFAGMYFVLFLIFLFPFIKKSVDERNKRMVYGYSILAGGTLLSILLTYSRTAFLMLFTGLIVYLLIYRKIKILLISLLVAILLIALTSNIKTEGLNPLRTASSVARIESTQQAVSIISKHPILGVGFNAYQFALFDSGFRREPVSTNHALGGTDNSFLFVTATTGIVGLVVYLYLFYSLIHVAKGRIAKKVFLADAVLASIIALGIGSFFINGLFYPMILFWMWILYGLIEA